MNYGTVADLSCPACGTSLRIVESFVKREDEILYGIISCECSEYPILDGILLLRSDDISQRVVKALTEYDFIGALLHFIRWDASISFSLLRKSPKEFFGSLLQFAKKASKLNFLLETDRLSFRQIIEKLGLGRYGNYLIHRFSCQSFWNVYALLPLLDEVGAPVLDFGCGAGHASFVFSHFFPSDKIFCIDVNFLNLILAKKYCVYANFICIDSNSPLPFKENCSSIIFCLDSFHYVNAKLTMSKEFQRIVKDEGVIVMPHLHNALTYNVSAGKPISASSYGDLFDNLKTVTFPEDTLLNSFLHQDCVDLGENPIHIDIDAYDTVTLIASHNQKVFKKYHEVKRYLFSMKDHIIINPIYKATENGNEVFLKRVMPRFKGVPDRQFMKEFYLTEEILPRTISVKKTFVEAIVKKRYELYESEIDKLMECFVLINVPNRY